MASWYLGWVPPPVTVYGRTSLVEPSSSFPKPKPERPGPGPSSHRPARPCQEPGKPTNTGQAIAAISVAAFAPAEEFKRQVDAAVRTMRGAERLPGVERIWLPGEQSHRKRLERAKSGVPVPKALHASLDATARDLGIEPLA